MHKASTVLAAGADFTPPRPQGHDAEQHQARRCRVCCSHRLRQEPDQPTRRPDSASTPASRLRLFAIRCPTAISRRCAFSASRPSTTSTPRTQPSRSARSTRRRFSSASSCTPVSTTPTSSSRRRRRPTSSSGTAATTTFPFYAPDLHIVVVDPLRPGHELLYHPGETNVRMADLVVVNKVDTAHPLDVEHGRRRTSARSIPTRRSFARPHP